MSQSLVQIYLHVVFSTKERRPFLQDAQLRERTHAYLAGTCQQMGAPSIIVDGTADHVHILCRLAKMLTVADLVKGLKRESSKWVKQQHPTAADFYWQSGYGAFSISPGHVEGLRSYIARQEEHHKKESFQDEFRRLCRKYDVEIDERYVWD
jgi:putative transposase